VALSKDWPTRFTGGGGGGGGDVTIQGRKKEGGGGGVLGQTGEALKKRGSRRPEGRETVLVKRKRE